MRWARILPSMIQKGTILSIINFFPISKSNESKSITARASTSFHGKEITWQTVCSIFSRRILQPRRKLSEPRSLKATRMLFYGKWIVWRTDFICLSYFSMFLQFPIGIDSDRFIRALEATPVQDNIRGLAERYKGRKVHFISTLHWC